MRSQVAPIPLRSTRSVSGARALSAATGRALLLAVLGLLGSVAAGCTNGAGGTCEIDQDCAAGLSCCNATLMRGVCQTDCSGVMAPSDAFIAPDAATDEDAPAIETDAFTAPDAPTDEADAAPESDAGVDGGA